MNAPTLDEVITSRFRELEARPVFPREQIRKKIAIISTPRCGSSLFCNVLLNTGMFGNPLEWFNPRFVAGYKHFFKLEQVNLHTYLDFILKKTTSPNGVFSVKFHVSHYHKLMDTCNYDLFSLNFDRVYYLSRRDKLAQAVSLHRALLTDQWTSTTREVDELPEKTSRSSVLQQLLYIGNSEDFYESHLESHVDGTYYYEDYRNLTETNIFNQVMSDCGISGDDFNWETSLAQQSDSVSQDELRAMKKYLGCANTKEY